MTRGGGVVDRGQLRALLYAYRRMTARGRAAGALAARGARNSGGALPLACSLYAVMGALIGAVLVGSADATLYGFVLHSFSLFAVGMALTVESGDVLFSPIESDVLGHRPIGPATLLLAKSLNLFGFGLVLTGSIHAIPSVIGFWVKGARPWFPAAHLLAAACQTAFVCAAVVFVYGAVARLVGRDRFESVAVWAQVGTSVLFVMGYQLVPRLVTGLAGAALPRWVLLGTPSGWFAALGAVLGGAGTRALLAPAGSGIALTFALGWLAIRKLSTGTVDSMGALREARVRRPAARASGESRLNAIAGAWMRDPVERAAFALAAAYMGRDRETKQRLYPSLASILVVPVMAFVSPGGGLAGGPFFSLFGLAMVATLSLTVVETLRLSSHHAAADVFLAAPLRTAGGLFHGARKAALLYVTLPAGLAMATLIGLTFRGGRDGLIAGLPLVLAIPTLSLLPGVAGDYVPLSRPPVRGEGGSANVALMFGGMLLTVVFAIVGSVAHRANAVLPVALAEIGILAAVHAAALRIIRSRRFPAA